MSTDAAFSVHATAVAFGRRAVLILGRSGAGKSSLAHALMSVSSPRRPIRLVGDDRVLLKRLGTNLPLRGGRGEVGAAETPSREAARFIVRPHPRIAGFIERRGLGIVAVPHAERAFFAGIIDLGGGETFPSDVGRENFPLLSLVNEESSSSRRDRVLGWWKLVEKRGLCTTHGQESASALPATQETLELVRPARSYICASRSVEAVRSN